ncbi:uncharacterized protein [Anabrus simplex]|uniref:uncharacterized protein n=1 Tax=Anabrus simplex TaxID=316456 RepID=UPI0034DDC659
MPLPHSPPSSEPSDTNVLFTFVAPPVRPLPNSPVFWRGHLLHAQEEGVLYPTVHFVEHHSDELPSSPHPNSDDFLHQGLYKEVKNIKPPGEHPPAKSSQSTCYILLGFKSLEKNFHQVMVNTWRDWTAARYIYMYLPDELGLARISLFQSLSTPSPSVFTYVVLVECRSVNTVQQQAQLLDFAQRLRVERVTGYISVYSSEPISRSGTPELKPAVPLRTSFSLNGSRYEYLHGVEATH